MYVHNIMQASPPVSKIALNCLLHCCWVQAGREMSTELHCVLTWTLHNEGDTLMYRNTVQ